MEKNELSKRQIENEVVFRRANERVEQGIEHEKKVALEQGDDISDFDDTPLHFYCECSDENCKERIVMTLPEYKALHYNRKQFIISPGHEVPHIEDTVKQKASFSVVKKYVVPPEDVTSLRRTDTGNV